MRLHSFRLHAVLLSGAMLLSGCESANEPKVTVISVSPNSSEPQYDKIILNRRHLTPSQEAGKEFINKLIELKDTPSLSTGTIRKYFGISVVDDPCCRSSALREGLERGSYPVTNLPTGIREGEFLVFRNLNSNNNGMSLYLKLSENSLCIDNSMLIESLGNNYNISRSTLRHFAPNQMPPPGIRPTQDSITYILSNLISITFSFDFSCASGVAINEHRPKDWAPSAIDLTLEPVARQ